MMVRTFTGHRFDLRTARPEDFRLDDIAHHLAHINRWGGAASRPFSVAQHSLHVAEILPWNLQVYGLIHDASDAYFGDIIAPIKHAPESAPLWDLEREVQARIQVAFGLDAEMPPEVKAADAIIQAIEARDLMGCSEEEIAQMGLPPAPVAARLVPWSAELAEGRFYHATRAAIEKHGRRVAA